MEINKRKQKNCNSWKMIMLEQFVTSAICHLYWIIKGFILKNLRSESYFPFLLLGRGSFSSLFQVTIASKDKCAIPDQSQLQPLVVQFCLCRLLFIPCTHIECLFSYFDLVCFVLAREAWPFYPLLAFLFVILSFLRLSPSL